MDSEPETHLQDRENFGPQTRWQAICANNTQTRPWLKNSPTCQHLQTHLIAHTGLMWAKHPFEVIRSEASGTFALIGLEGEGETLIDGDWHTLLQNEICLLPAFAPTAIRAKKQQTWNFAWVRYEETKNTSPILSATSPVIQKGNPLPLKHAIAGLAAELENKSTQTSTHHHWVELIHNFVTHAASPFQSDDRLWRIWKAVEKNLAHNWNLTDLEAIAHLSQEHIRRLSKQQLGRSPIQQITYLRMRRAVSLLTTSDDKIETIAKAVGYEDPFTFSNAFKRWTGKRPSHYRHTNPTT